MIWQLLIGIVVNLAFGAWCLLVPLTRFAVPMGVLNLIAAAVGVGLLVFLERRRRRLRERKAAAIVFITDELLDACSPSIAMHGDRDGHPPR